MIKIKQAIVNNKDEKAFVGDRIAVVAKLFDDIETKTEYQGQLIDITNKNISVWCENVIMQLSLKNIIDFEII